MNPLTFLESKGIDLSKTGNYKLKADSFMDLTVEVWHYADGKTNISMCHYGEMNGDLMKDPDILFEFGSDKKILYKEFQNDYVGFYSTDHAETKDFMENTWIPNLKDQGHEIVKEIEN